MQLEEIAHLVLTAKKPLIMAGHGVRLAKAKNLLIATVVEFEIDFIVTSHVKGYLPENLSQFIGVIGFACDPIIESKIKSLKPDLILCLGTRLGELATLGWTSTIADTEYLIQVLNNENDFNDGYQNAIKVCFDLVSLLQEIWKKSRKIYPDTYLLNLIDSGRNLDQITKNNKILDQSIDLFQSPINPINFIKAIEKTLTQGTILVSDIGNSMAWLIRYIGIDSDVELFIPLGFGSMGSGIGAAIGAKKANPQRPVICITGDCSFNMFGSEILTAKEHELPIIIIILNDAGHGMVDHGHKLIGLPDINVRFKSPVNYSLIAEAYGCTGKSINNIDQFINLNWNDLLNSKAPILIDVAIDKTIVPPIKARARILGQSELIEKR